MLSPFQQAGAIQDLLQRVSAIEAHLNLGRPGREPQRSEPAQNSSTSTPEAPEDVPPAELTPPPPDIDAPGEGETLA